MTKAKQTKKAKKKATMKVLPSSTKGGGEKGSGSMNTTVSTNMVTRGSVAVPRKETVSTPVTSNKETKKTKVML